MEAGLYFYSDCPVESRERLSSDIFATSTSKKPLASCLPVLRTSSSALRLAARRYTKEKACPLRDARALFSGVTCAILVLRGKQVKGHGAFKSRRGSAGAAVSGAVRGEAKGRKIKFKNHCALKGIGHI